MNVVIAPNAFKGSLSAHEVGQAVAEGLQKSRLTIDNCAVYPIADGGDGTLEVLTAAMDGVLQKVEVSDPLGRTISAAYGLSGDGKTAIIEMAKASGLALLLTDELNPLKADTFGTGELVNHALSQGAEHIIMTLGGSATVDGALGMLCALGLKIFGNAGKYGGGVLENITEIDPTALFKKMENIKFTLLCDVDNPLLGSQGAAAVFGPQKGASPEQVKQLEVGLAHFSKLTDEVLGVRTAEIKHGGAAGGAAAFLSAYLHAEIKDGIAFIMDLLGIDQALADAQLMITAEGRIDEQTIQGKGPYGVARKAKAYGCKVVALAGQVAPDIASERFEAFDAIFPVASGPMTLDDAIRHTHENIVRTAHQIGNLLS